MTTNNKCPLCGKSIQEEDNELCSDCRNHADNQYSTNFFSKEDASVEEKEIKTDREAEINTVQDIQSSEQNNLTPRKKKISKTLLFILICCVLIIVLGTLAMINVKNQRSSVEFEQRFWDSCVVVNTPLSYAKYLVTFQKGSYIDEAHNRIRELRIEEDLRWEKLKSSSDINDYYNYLSDNPNTPYSKAARLKMDSLSWDATTKADTPDAYLAYLDNSKLGNITGIYSTVAQEKYDYLSQMKNIEGESLDSLKTQLATFYLALSDYDEKVVQKEMTSKVIFHSQELESRDVITYIKQDLKKNKIKKVNYQTNRNSIKAIKDNKGITFVDLLVNKETTNTANKKNYTVDTLIIELNQDNNIQSVNLK